MARRPGLDLDLLRAALSGSAASSKFVREDLASLLDGDYLTTFGPDRCCEELAQITAAASELKPLRSDSARDPHLRTGPVRARHD